jgi:hypothetical protein
VGGQVDASSLGPEAQEVRHGFFTKLGDGADLELGPACVDQFPEMTRGDPFPVSFGTEGIVEDPGDLDGEPLLESPFGSTDSERQPHETPLFSATDADPNPIGQTACGGTGNVRGPGLEKRFDGTAEALGLDSPGRAPYLRRP